MNQTKRLAESAMLIAIAIVLEVVSKLFIPNMPFGGQITIASMLPVILISYRYGMRWGFVSAFAYSFIEILFGIKNVSAAFLPGYFGDDAAILNAIIMCLCDYVFAFTALGLGGLFRNRIAAKGPALALGGVVALSVRYFFHIVSGYVLFREYAVSYFTQEGFPVWGVQLVEALSPELLGFLYSAVYNATFMLPEILITALCSLALAKIPGLITKVR